MACCCSLVASVKQTLPWLINLEFRLNNRCTWFPANQVAALYYYGYHQLNLGRCFAGGYNGHGLSGVLL